MNKFSFLGGFAIYGLGEIVPLKPCSIYLRGTIGLGILICGGQLKHIEDIGEAVFS